MSKYIMFDLNDSRSSKIAEVMSNKTCKKILELIAEKEMSETEIASSLGLPLNTVDYNIKNLVSAGLIEPAKNIVWSVKGKRVLKYRVSNKKIVISPKSMFKGIVPAILLTGIAAYFVKLMTSNSFSAGSSGSLESKGAELTAGASGAAQSAVDNAAGAMAHISNYGYSSGVLSAPIWAWFALGGLVALLIYVILKMISDGAHEALTKQGSLMNGNERRWENG